MSFIAPPFAGLSFGSIGVRILVGAVNPNSGPDNGSGDLAGAAVGSIFLCTVDGSLWSKTGASNQGANPFGVWTSRT